MSIPFDHRCQVIENRPCGENLKILRLKSLDKPFQCLPGQFVMLDLPDTRFFFRRPFSVLNVNSDGSFEIYYKIVGTGTEMMADFAPGQTMNILGPLGNSFTLPEGVTKQPILLIGGGIGIAPLYFLARQHPEKTFHGVYGVRSKTEVGLQAELNQVLTPDSLSISTDDGSLGTHGTVCDVLQNQAALIQSAALACVCGPTNMMAAVVKLLHSICPNLPVQVSLEEHMPCGTGACTGCVVFTTDGSLPAKVCVEGPVFDARRVILTNAACHLEAASCPR